MKKKLKEIMKDEKKAPGDYKVLKKELKRKSDKKIVASIIKDEKKHLKLLKKIKKRE